MALTPEWRGRIEAWQKVLERLCYRKLADASLEGFTTMERLTPHEAARRRFRRMPAGTEWGAKWEYGWFRCTVVTPKEAAGERLVLRCGDGVGFTINPSGEGRFIVNGREAGGRDWAHPQVTLAHRAQPGQKFDVLMEVYAGHGPTVWTAGPCPEGEVTIPEPPAKQLTVPVVSLGIWEEMLYQAWLDVQTLLEVRDCVDADSLRAAEIDAGLREFTQIADLELPREAMLRWVREARARLKRLLACRNGSTAPVLYCFGHSHTDVAWLWPLMETERKCARTFATQLALMEEYPEYRFLQSQACLYEMTRRLYPELYERIRRAVRRGQWIVEGGMWVEADTNIAGGESLIRQFIHGKRFFRDEFGVDCELLWLPDVFGYSGSLPQIMAGCGVRYFSTQKIFWNYNGGEMFPYNTFWWEGIDGTKVLSHIHNDYNSQTNPATLMERWKQRVQKDGISARIVPFGWGDGGGGPTRTHLEFLRRQRNLEGAPRARIASPLEFFRREARRAKGLRSYVGELYFQAHRGTYTTQSRTKRGNRRCEFALREAEFWATAAKALGCFEYPVSQMDEAWKGLLLNQFHDILPGSSIRRVYEEAETLFARVLEAAEKVAREAAGSLVRKKSNSLTVFNSLCWPRSVLVKLPSDMRGAALDGRALAVQRVGDARYTELVVPACGAVGLRAAEPGKAENSIRVDCHTMENECLRAEFNDRGEITSLMDKATGQQWAAGPMNQFRMFKDVPRAFDAWDIDSTYEAMDVELFGRAEVDVVAAGPLVGVLRIRRVLDRSTLVQEIWLRRNSRQLEFRTAIDWRQKHRLLKVCFPTTVHAKEALHEIQFGHLRRPAHRSRPYDADRFEVVNQKWTALVEENRGAAVLNDCKYGVNVFGGSINLTLLRATLAPDMTADQGSHEFAYAFTFWNGPFIESGVVREGYELNTPVVAIGGEAQLPSLFELDAPNVILEALKAAEDGSGDVVVRLYEAYRATTRCTLRTTLEVAGAWQTNMLEERRGPVAVRDGQIVLRFRPFEIKTVRLVLGRRARRMRKR